MVRLPFIALMISVPQTVKKDEISAEILIIVTQRLRRFIDTCGKQLYKLLLNKLFLPIFYVIF